MCKANPGHRCDGDSKKALDSAIDRYGKAYDEMEAAGERPSATEKVALTKWNKLNARLTRASDNVIAKVEDYHATEAAQDDSVRARGVAVMIHNKLSIEAADKLNIDSAYSIKVGKAINSFKNVFTEALQNDPDENHIKHTRDMANGGFLKHRKTLTDESEALRDQKLKKLADEGKDTPEMIRAVKKDNYRTVMAASLAYARVQKEAKAVVKKDCDKNSEGYNNSITKTRYAYLKNTDGTFTVVHMFKVKGKNFEDVVDQSEASFKIDGVQSTYSPVPSEPGTYDVTSKYVYSGGDIEKLDDMDRWNRDKAWDGPPAWRQTMNQVKYLEDHPY